MTVETDITRNTALAIVEAEGITWKRVGKGQRFVIHLSKAGEIIPTLVKTASKGSALIRTDIDDADNAQLSGFGSDVTHVLFAVGEPSSSQVSAFLVPKAEVDFEYRSTHKRWRARHPAGSENLTWVLWFNDKGDADCNGFHRKWAHFRIGTSSPRTADSRNSEHLSIAEVKSRLAFSLGIDPSSIKITIEA